MKKIGLLNTINNITSKLVYANEGATLCLLNTINNITSKLSNG